MVHVLFKQPMQSYNGSVYWGSIHLPEERFSEVFAVWFIHAYVSQVQIYTRDMRR